MSADEAAPARPPNVPSSAISVAACMKPAHAARASAPPTLIRRTPASASSATVVNRRRPARSRAWAPRRDDGRDVRRAIADPGRTGNRRRPRRRPQPRDRLGEVGPADDEPLRPAGEHDARPARVDRAARGPDPLDREREVEQRRHRHRRSNPRSRARRSRSRRARDVGRHISGSTANPPSKSALTGSSTAPAIARRCASTSSSDTPLSGAPERPGEARSWSSPAP